MQFVRFMRVLYYMACGNIPILDSVLMHIVACIYPCVPRNIISHLYVYVYRGAHPEHI